MLFIWSWSSYSKLHITVWYKYNTNINHRPTEAQQKAVPEHPSVSNALWIISFIIPPQTQLWKQGLLHWNSFICPAVFKTDTQETYHTNPGELKQNHYQIQYCVFFILKWAKGKCLSAYFVGCVCELFFFKLFFTDVIPQTLFHISQLLWCATVSREGYS